MEIRYCCTHWGSEKKAPLEFLEDLLGEGYSGLEINLSPETKMGPAFFDRLAQLRSENKFAFIAQQVLDAANETSAEYTKRMNERLRYLNDFQPDFINSHTGKDFFSFDENCRIIDAAENISAKFGIPILHETHRGRFTFHLSTLLPYLKKFPTLKLTGDFSHWCTVSESMLEDQAENLQQAIPHIGHIHARVGFAQAPQVNHPFAPEWNGHFKLFLKWWQSIIDYQIGKGKNTFTITPEFGPFPYMPTKPFSQELVANQCEINVQMKNYLRQKLKL